MPVENTFRTPDRWFNPRGAGFAGLPCCRTPGLPPFPGSRVSIKKSVRNRNLILYGILLKVSYCSIVLYHWATLTASIWKPFCIADIIFLVLFVYTWRATGKSVGAQN